MALPSKIYNVPKYIFFIYKFDKKKIMKYMQKNIFTIINHYMDINGHGYPIKKKFFFINMWGL